MKFTGITTLSPMILISISVHGNERKLQTEGGGETPENFWNSSFLI